MTESWSLYVTTIGKHSKHTFQSPKVLESLQPVSQSRCKLPQSSNKCSNIIGRLCGLRGGEHGDVHRGSTSAKRRKLLQHLCSHNGPLLLPRIVHKTLGRANFEPERRSESAGRNKLAAGEPH